MRNIFIQLAIAFFILFPNFATSAPESTQAKIDYEVFKVQTDAKLKAIKEAKNDDIKDIEASSVIQNIKIEAFDKRISDLSFYLAIYAILGTVLGIAVAIATLLTAKSKAKESAQEWFKDNQADLQKRIDGLIKQLESHSEQARTEITSTVKDFQNWKESTISPSQKAALEASSDKLKDKAESSYNFKNWFTRASSAYAEGNYALAAEYSLKAANAHDAKDSEILTTLLNRAYVLGEHLNQPEAEIATYDALIEKYGNASQPRVQEQVARACFNKGFTQNAALKKPEAAIATYDALIEKYSNSSHAGVQKQVAKTYVNKAVTQSRELKKPELAIATYDALIEKYSNSSHAGVQEQVARALNGKGFNLLLKAKQQWGDIELCKAELKQALNLFNTATGKAATNDKGMVLGNIAYTHHLLGQHENVASQLKEALILGGEKLYKGTLADTEQYTIPEDATFKDLVEQAWTEANPNKHGGNV